MREIYPHLACADEEASKSFNEHWDKVLQAVKKMRVFTLSKMEGDEKEEAPVDPSPHAESGADNQKLNFAAALLAAGDWPSSQYMLEALSPIMPAAYGPIAESLSRLVHKVIDPAYQSVMNSNGLLDLMSGNEKESSLKLEGLEYVNSSAELDRVMPLMNHLGIYIHQDPVLYVKLCRLLKHYTSQLNGKEVPQHIRDLLLHLMSSLALIPCNSALANDLWECMKELHYLDRYWVYAELHWKGYSSNPALVLERAKYREEMRKLLKGLTKENILKKRRYLGKLCHSNPLVVLEVMMDQIQEYESMIHVSDRRDSSVPNPQKRN